MDTHLTRPLRTRYSQLNSSRTLFSSSASILFDKAIGPSDFDEDLSPLSQGTFPYNDPSDGESFPGDNIDSKDGDNEDCRLTHFSPVNTYSYASHWSGPWNPSDSTPAWQSSNFGGMEDNIASEDSPVIDWSPRTNLEMKSSFSALITGQKPPYVGAGLANLGNTCFLNVILQCFTYTVPLHEGLHARRHKVPCQCYFEGFCVFCNLYEQIELSLSNSGGVVSPVKFFNNLNYFSSSFQRFQQEDAHEFLQYFLDKLESCGNDFKYADNDSIVKKVFGGRLVSTLRCCNCGHCSDTYEPLIDVSLEIDEVSSLSTALESFTRVEKIEDPETKFTCENCKEKVSVEKQLMLEQAPSVATFHLKRFKNDGSFVEKIDNHVAFPLELDLIPYTGGNQSNKVEMKYDLYAVVVHAGISSTFGHYYCFIRTAPNEWYRFDDSKVSRVDQELVLQQEAYILFYVKHGSPAFSSFFEKHKKQMDSSLLNNSPKSVLDIVERTSSPTMQRHCPYDAKGTRDIAEAACVGSPSGFQDGEDTLSGRKGGGMMGDSDKKEEPMSPLPSSCNPLHISSHDINERASVSMVNNSSDVPSFEACKSSALPVVDGTADVPDEACKSTGLPVPDERNSIRERIELGNSAGVLPTVPPPRSSSPEIYREDPPDSSFSIPRDHLRAVMNRSCKRQLNKDLEDPGRKLACTFVKKNMPGTRGKQLMAAINGPLREASSINTKRSRGVHASPESEDRRSASRRRGRIPVLASSVR